MNSPRIIIPKPCNENWDTMSEISMGKHCQVCSTEVIDFSVMTTIEIAEYLKRNSKQKLCVRIESPYYKSDSSSYFSKISKSSKRFLYALAIAFFGFIALPVVSQAEKKIELRNENKNPNGVSGRVHNESGEGIGKAKVAIFKGKERIAQVQTDSTGYFSLIDLPPGKYDIAVKAKYYKVRAKKVKIKNKMRNRNFILKAEQFITGCPRF